MKNKYKKNKNDNNIVPKQIELYKLPYCYTQYPWSPCPDNVNYFVGREIEFIGFWIQMANLVGRGEEQRSNYAFVGQRKLGKTAYLKRCYNIAFWEQDEVVPFYYSFAQDDEESQRQFLQLADLKRDMPLMFLKQFFAFCTRDQKFTDLETYEKLFDYLKNLKFPRLEDLMDGIEANLNRINESQDIFVLRDIWHLTQYLTLFVRKKCTLIIDEAQEMDISIYDGTKQWKCKNSIADIIQKEHSLVMVSGSNVSMLVNNFLGYSFANRFQKQDFFPLRPNHAKELIRQKCPDGYKNLENDLFELVGGNPFYINKMLSFNMYYLEMYGVNKDFSCKEGLKKAYDFEVLNSKGTIHFFWQTHIRKNKDDLNRDPKGKKGLTLQILYKISKNPYKEITYDSLMKEFAVDENTLMSKIKQLENANLIEPTRVSLFAYAFPDKVLPVIINHIYHKIIIEGPNKSMAKEAKEDYNAIINKLKTVIDETGIELGKAKEDMSSFHEKMVGIKFKRLELSAEIKSALGTISLRKGAMKENTICEKVRSIIEKQEYMFTNCKLEGEISSINIRSSKGTGCEIDIFAKLSKKQKGKKKESFALLVEVKDWATSIQIGQAKKFMSSVKKATEKYNLKDVTTVYISTKGFSANAKKYLESYGVKCASSQNVFMD